MSPELRSEATLSLEPAEATAAEVPTTELLISNLLRVGVASSLALVVLGVLWSFTRHPDWMSSHEELRRLAREHAAPHNLGDVLRGLGGAHGRALTMVGLLLLIALPVARVGLSLVLFAQRKDRAYVAITSVVLALLVLSFALGKVAH
ncbi:DUF1634 domain-containing protein [Myxococcaceae bacterium GXIMD 01537]